MKNNIKTMFCVLCSCVIAALTGCSKQENQPISNPHLPQLSCSERSQKAAQIEELAKKGQSMQQIYDALTPATASIRTKSENMMLIPPVVDAVQKNEFKGATFIGEQCEKNKGEYLGYQAQVCAIFSPILQLAVNERDAGNTEENTKEKATKKIIKLIGSDNSERNLLAGNVMTSISNQIVHDTYAQPQKPLKNLIDDFNDQCMLSHK